MNFFKHFDTVFKSCETKNKKDEEKQMKAKLTSFFANYDETYILVK